MEDFEWAKDIKASIMMKPNTDYFIECGDNFDEDTIRKAFNKIFGVEMVDHSVVNRLNNYLNLFDNNMIHQSIEQGNPITFRVTYDDEFIDTGWSQIDYYRNFNPDGVFIPMDDFINYCVIEGCYE
jgi:hypothetical protein